MARIYRESLTPIGLPLWRLERLEEGLFFLFWMGKLEKHLLLINILAGILQIFYPGVYFSYTAKLAKFGNSELSEYCTLNAVSIVRNAFFDNSYY